MDDRDLERDVAAGIRAVIEATGRQPNTLLIGMAVIRELTPDFAAEIEAECPGATYVVLTADGWQPFVD